MAKFLIDGQALEYLGSKLQQLEELFNVIQSEAQITMRACVNLPSWTARTFMAASIYRA
ncbi:hypothetical protein BDI4_300048 [Burkholderia diffusa]|uniref:hypothetical protein n=1 Tax=Burkholderia diffusa TaxID=488732 RepID=UPI001CB06137|nr:hypothetical protein [Burkholderia diffusa]CAG9251359.1 hypothetical protein BDI4_300048 [Burkholderia diffusa]